MKKLSNKKFKQKVERKKIRNFEEVENMQVEHLSHLFAG